MQKFLSENLYPAIGVDDVGKHPRRWRGDDFLNKFHFAFSSYNL